MRALSAIEALYNELDRFLETNLDAARDQAEIERTKAKQRLNDQAYFVLCWGQLESAIDDAARGAIRKRITSPKREVRRGWDLHNPDDKRLSGLSLEDRTALVLDRNSGAGSPWALVMSYYALRNQIAHGKLLPDRIDVSAVTTVFYQIQSALES